jgi:hypothetical protein
MVLFLALERAIGDGSSVSRICAASKLKRGIVDLSRPSLLGDSGLLI